MPEVGVGSLLCVSETLVYITIGVITGYGLHMPPQYHLFVPTPPFIVYAVNVMHTVKHVLFILLGWVSCSTVL